MTMTKITTMARGGRKMLPHQQQQLPQRPRFRFLSCLSVLGFIALFVLMAQFASIARTNSSLYDHNNHFRSTGQQSSLDAFFFGPTTIKALNHQNATRTISQALSAAKGTLPFHKVYQTSSVCNDCRIHFPDVVVQSSRSSLSKATATASVYTVKGQKGGSPNQDRIALITSLQGDFELGVLFDGHGVSGHEHAQMALVLVPPALLQLQQQQHQQQESVLEIQNTMAQIDEQIIQYTPLDGGTTAVMAFVQRNMLHLISIGDSTGLVVKYSSRDHPSCTILAQSVKHKPGDPLERARIRAAGGIVVDPINPMDSSRVLFRDTVSGLPLALAMSRSLGDADGKKLRVVISEPSVVSVNLHDIVNDKDHDASIFVLLASDGVMDMVPRNEVVESLGEALYANPGDKESLEKASLEILERARQGWANASFGTYRDDMSLLVSKVKTKTT